MTGRAMVCLPAHDCLNLLGKPGYAPIDVRSEGEFAKGHLPGFVNLPILRDSERHQVGLAYKVQGQAKAVTLGHELVSSEREQRIQSWTLLAQGGTALVSCWRGGMRSKIATEWMREAGAEVLRVEGGYKALRAELLPLFATPGPLWVLSGYTGSGKTDLLRSFPGEWSIDLEAMARHRGSQFGGLYDEPQPRQATFENRLGLKIFQERHPHLVEDESIRIGKVSLPVEFKRRMIEAPLIILEASIEERADRIHSEYVVQPIRDGIDRNRVLENLRASTRALERRLGGVLAAEICTILEKVFASPANDSDPAAHREWIAPLLAGYYDHFYRYSIDGTGRKIAFRGDEKECKEWIGKTFASLRP